MGIKKELDDLYGITDEEIDKIILGQKIEDEEEKLKILKELVEYKSFKEWVDDHEKDFELVDITDDFNMIIIPAETYPNIDLGLVRKIGIVADHFGIFIHIDKNSKVKIKDKTRDSGLYINGDFINGDLNE